MDERGVPRRGNRFFPLNKKPHRGRFGRLNWPRIFLASLLTVGIAASFLLVGALAYLAWLMPTLPNIGPIEKIRTAQPSVIVAADGTPLGEFRRLHQEPVPLERISPHVIDALIATEDHRFAEHRGVDFRRTAAAIFHTLSGDGQGGSTITQQLARNLFPEKIGRSRTLHRKVREMMTAMRIERAYSKQQILETYLNTVPFLYNAYGIEMAARTYFNKTAAELDLVESATLVGMLKGTHYYNPVTSPARALTRRNVVLGQMVRHGHISQAQFQRLGQTPLQATLNRPTETLGPAPHFTAHVRKWLTQWAEQNERDLYADGLVVETTLDMNLQQAAARAVERQAQALQHIADVEWSQNSPRLSHSTEHYARLQKQVEPFRHFWNSRPELLDTFIRETPIYRKAVAAGEPDASALAAIKADPKLMRRLRADKTRLEAGFTAIDPASGEIKAWVGSRNFAQDQFDHVAQAARQPGSTFKPFVYGAALELGINPRRTYAGGPVQIRLVDGGIWRPTDMTATSEPMTLREGLIHSKNTITAQVMQDAGIGAVVDMAQAMGIRQSRLDPVMSLALGTSPVTLLEMVSAYSTIAMSGTYRQPVFIKRITDRDGRVLAEFGGEPARQAMSSQAAIELIDMMRGVVERGTGQKVKQRFSLAADIAGKTGTTQNNTDGWFILMHPNLVAGAWVGFNDQRVTMRSDYWGQGGHNAILIVGDFFRDTLKHRRIDSKAKFPRPQRAPLWVDRSPPGQDDGEANDRYAHGVPPGHGVIIHRDGSRTIIGDAQGVHSMLQSDRDKPVRNADELARALSDMGRDPQSAAHTNNEPVRIVEPVRDRRDLSRSEGGAGDHSAGGPE